MRHEAIGLILRQARLEAGLGLRELARRAGTSHATLGQYEHNAKVPSAGVFMRLLEACGYGVDVTLRRRIRERNGMARGDELMEVLRLADQFPSNPGATLEFPRFGA